MEHKFIPSSIFCFRVLRMLDPLVRINLACMIGKFWTLYIIWQKRDSNLKVEFLLLDLVGLSLSKNIIFFQHDGFPLTVEWVNILHTIVNAQFATWQLTIMNQHTQKKLRHSKVSPKLNQKFTNIAMIKMILGVCLKHDFCRS